MSKLILLGPQRKKPRIAEAAKIGGMKAPIALITAGWQEREHETADLRSALGIKIINLDLHTRSERIFKKDPVLREVYRAHQERLRRLQELYRRRLNHLMAAVEELFGRSPALHPATAPEVWEPELASAIDDVVRLDAHHLSRIETFNREFFDREKPQERSMIHRHRQELGNLISQCGGLMIAGGHVAVLLNRMRLFGIKELIRDLPVTAWSAGAMAISERVVLFHDTPPQGRGYAEVFQQGLGLARNIVPLPYARKRLLLHNEGRVTAFARRFHFAKCFTLDEDDRLVWDGKRWSSNDSALLLGTDGSVGPVEGSWN